jgi:hypothetical protein
MVVVTGWLVGAGAVVVWMRVCWMLGLKAMSRFCAELVMVAVDAVIYPSWRHRYIVVAPLSH